MSSKKSNVDKKSLGERIKQVRLTKNLTQQSFADSLGIAQGFLSELEQGKYPPTKPLLLSIVYLYQINFDWLETGEGEMEKPAYEQPEELKKGVVKEEKGVYTTRPTIGKILIMLEEMGDDDLREVLRFLEKEKLLKDLLENKKRGRGNK